MEKRLLYAIILSLLILIVFDKLKPQLGQAQDKIETFSTAKTANIAMPPQEAILKPTVANNVEPDFCVDIPAYEVRIDCNQNAIYSYNKHAQPARVIISWANLPKDIKWVADKGTFTNEGFITMVPDDEKLASNYKVTYEFKGNGIIKAHLDSIMDSAFTIIAVDKNAKNNNAFLSFEGFLTYDGTVSSISYNDLKTESFTYTGNTLWTALTTKTWVMSAFVPDNAVRLRALKSDTRIQSDILLNPSNHAEVFILTGNKTIDLVNKFRDQYNVPLFDRTIDYGLLWFMVKPIYWMQTALSKLLNSAGWSIIIIVVMLKVIMVPISLKIRRMRAIAPMIKEVQKLYADNRERMGREIMQLYKRENVSPFTGCLPLIIQMPLFFGLYKALYISSDIVNKPFSIFKDLSLPDDHRVFNLFGLLDSPENLGFILEAVNFNLIGMLLALSLYANMKVNSSFMATDNPSIALAMNLLPLMMLFIAVSLPSGYILFWLVSNIGSIVEAKILDYREKLIQAAQ